MNLAVASYAFHGLFKAGQIDLFGYLESCRYRYNLDTADIWNRMLRSLDADYLATVKQGLAERALTLVNLCVDGPHIWVDDPAEREQHYQDALRYLAASVTLGARTLRIDAGVREDTFTEEQFDGIVTRFREYAQFAYDHGFRVGPENHWGAEVVPENMRRICKAVDHPGFGVLLHLRGNDGDALMAPWAMHTHLAWEITSTTLAASMTMLRDAGYQGCWSAEYHEGQNEYSAVAIQLAQVRHQLGLWAN